MFNKMKVSLPQLTRNDDEFTAAVDTQAGPGICPIAGAALRAYHISRADAKNALVGKPMREYKKAQANHPGVYFPSRLGDYAICTSPKELPAKYRRDEEFMAIVAEARGLIHRKCGLPVLFVPSYARATRCVIRLEGWEDEMDPNIVRQKMDSLFWIDGHVWMECLFGIADDGVPSMIEPSCTGTTEEDDLISLLDEPPFTTEAPHQESPTSSEAITVKAAGYKKNFLSCTVVSGDDDASFVGEENEVALDEISISLDNLEVVLDSICRKGKESLHPTTETRLQDLEQKTRWANRRLQNILAGGGSPTKADSKDTEVWC